MPPSIQQKRISKVSEISAKSRQSRFDLGSNDAEWSVRNRYNLKPDDQLQLTDNELNEEIARVLTTHNNKKRDDLVEWSFKELEYVKLPEEPDIACLLNVTGVFVHKDSDEAKRQLAGGILDDDEDTEAGIKYKKGGGEEDDEEEEEEKKKDHENVNERDEGIEAGDEFKQEKDEVEADDEASEAIAGEDDEKIDADDDDEAEKEANVGNRKPKKTQNLFNFCNRAALTYTNVIRDNSTQTVPPPTATMSGSVYQWTILDDYKADYAQQQRDKEKERRGGGGTTTVGRKDDFGKRKKQQETSATTTRMLTALKTLERMVNQNVYDEILQDYRYWDDPSDEFKEGEGSLLPLWKFNYDKYKRYDVTEICFNPRYYDLFAVAYGSMTYNNPMPNGSICLFSIKNPSYPEWICPTESPVMSLNFNPQHPNLLVIGTLDGTVAVYDIMTGSTTPQYKSNTITQKHADIVWQVIWAPETDDGKQAFYSVSVDGKINHWLLNQSDLGLTTIMTLLLDEPPVPGPDGTTINLIGCGTCMTFKPDDAQAYFVGTEEGNIYKCNINYSSVYVKTYPNAHDMPIYRIVFNKFNNKVFASCSADWTIKIWEDDWDAPLFTFEVGVAVGDVQWAPYSSTVIACVTDDGKVNVYDLNVNKYRPICSQAIVNKRRGKLTRLAFNPTLPFVIVGDDKGTINSLKLSPNLRKKIKPTKKQAHLTMEDLEIAKLEKLLSFVREPEVLPRPKDINIIIQEEIDKMQ